MIVNSIASTWWLFVFKQFISFSHHRRRIASLAWYSQILHFIKYLWHFFTIANLCVSQKTKRETKISWSKKKHIFVSFEFTHVQCYDVYLYSRLLHWRDYFKMLRKCRWSRFENVVNNFVGLLYHEIIFQVEKFKHVIVILRFEMNFDNCYDSKYFVAFYYRYNFKLIVLKTYDTKFVATTMFIKNRRRINIRKHAFIDTMFVSYLSILWFYDMHNSYWTSARRRETCSRLFSHAGLC